MLKVPQNSELILSADDPLNSMNGAIKSLESFSEITSYAHPFVLQVHTLTQSFLSDG
jgi:hypothetical protein